MLLVYWQVDTGRYSIPVLAFFFQLQFAYLIDLFACMIDQKGVQCKRRCQRDMQTYVLWEVEANVTSCGNFLAPFSCWAALQEDVCLANIFLFCLLLIAA